MGLCYYMLALGLQFTDKKCLAFRSLDLLLQVWSFFINASSLIHIPQVHPFFKLLEFCLLGFSTVPSYQQQVYIEKKKKSDTHYCKIMTFTISLISFIAEWQQ